MLAEFSIYPMHTAHMSQDVAQVVKVLEGTGLKFRLGPMGTCVEGDMEEVLSAIKHCHQAVASGHDRVITTIAIDDCKKSPHHLSEMVTSVEQQIGHRLSS